MHIKIRSNRPGASGRVSAGRGSADPGAPACAITVVHQDLVNSLKHRLPSPETAYELADFYKVLGDSTRLGILSALLAAEMCVCDLAALLGMSQSAVSHQLRVLRQARLVRFRREGRVIYYTLQDEHVRSILALGFEHVGEVR